MKRGAPSSFARASAKSSCCGTDAPQVSRKSAPNEMINFASAKLIRGAIRGKRRLVSLEVDAEVRTHAGRREPLIEKSWKTSALVLVEEHRRALTARLPHLFAEQRDGFIPRDELPD